MYKNLVVTKSNTNMPWLIERKVIAEFDAATGEAKI
jgi:hypothetical protein